MEKIEPLINNNFSIYNYEQSYKVYTNKCDYYSAIIEILTKLKSIAEKFLKEKLEQIKIKDDLNSKSKINDNYMKLVSLIKEEMITNISNSIKVINEITENLSNSTEEIKSNSKNYTDYLNFKNLYNTKFNELQNCKNKYFTSAEKAEDLTLEFLDKKIQNKHTDPNEFEKKNKIQNDCREEKEKYLSKLNEVNELIKTLNEKQQIIFNINKTLEKMFCDKYINSLFSIYQLISEGTAAIEKKNEIKVKTIEMTNLSHLIGQFQFKEEKQIEFVQYVSKIDFNDCFDSFRMGIYITTCQEMQKILGNYVEDEFEICKQKVNLNIKLKNLLNLDDKISEQEEKEILDLLDKEIGQKCFINNLSQLRTNGKLEKSKKFIIFLGKALNKLIDYERENNDYNFMKSILILSQTFYYLELNEKDKKYIFEYIKNDEWLKTPYFWRDFINNMLEIEFKIDDKHKEKSNDLLFTQLIPYIKNMKEFRIDNRIIVKIIDEILNKYDCTKPGIYGSPFVLINNDPKEIEKLRKEYQDNPDLENQLYKNNLNVKTNENKKNNEEENNEDKEENNIKKEGNDNNNKNNKEKND